MKSGISYIGIGYFWQAQVCSEAVEGTHTMAAANTTLRRRLPSDWV